MEVSGKVRIGVMLKSASGPMDCLNVKKNKIC